MCKPPEDTDDKTRTFKDPTNNDIISEMSKKHNAKGSEIKIKWAVNMYTQWKVDRIKSSDVAQEIKNADLSCFYSFTQHDLYYALSRFIGEVKEYDGCDYPPNTIREIIIMIQMYLQKNSILWKLLDHPDFNTLKKVVDNTMKERTALGLGVRKSCDIISLESCCWELWNIIS